MKFFKFFYIDDFADNFSVFYDEFQKKKHQLLLFLLPVFAFLTSCYLFYATFFESIIFVWWIKIGLLILEILGILISWVLITSIKSGKYKIENESTNIGIIQNSVIELNTAKVEINNESFKSFFKEGTFENFEKLSINAGIISEEGKWIFKGIKRDYSILILKLRDSQIIEIKDNHKKQFHKAFENYFNLTFDYSPMTTIIKEGYEALSNTDKETYHLFSFIDNIKPSK